MTDDLVERLRAKVDRLPDATDLMFALADIRALLAELEAARPVVEAAVAFVDLGGHLQHGGPLIAAVDLYRSATSDHPSTTEEKP